MARSETNSAALAESGTEGASPVSQNGTITSMQMDRRRVVAVVDDDPTARRILRHWLGGEGYEVVEHADAASALAADPTELAAACVDLGLGDSSGLDLMKQLLARDAELPVVMVTASQEVEPAVGALRAGAYDYVTKPLDRERLLGSVRRAAERRHLALSVRRLETELRGTRALGALVGSSPAMRLLSDQVARVLESDVPVYVFGESGTGKELVARAIHESGRRHAGPFIALNCGAIPQSLQASELFGHERGAFTGAQAQHRGRFEQAHGGTLFLDEVGEMSASTQTTLLRALQERTIQRVGGRTDIPVDARVICASNRKLDELVAQGSFREDLYYRLVVFPIHVPPLRERASDIPELVVHFLHKLAPDTKKHVARVSPEALEALMAYEWPGNVRELGNVVHRALLCCDGEQIELGHLPHELWRGKQSDVVPALAPTRAPQAALPPDLFDLREVERLTIERAVKKTGGNITEAARILGIGRATLYRKLTAYAAD
ncbi:MAG: sigma-54-dependent Fis family transcriptional regulator [Sorangiineae bacterium PRO1]|nr:sigma-54-dependent Fis family transcriptional regulator [Sorangiineae bacterium PRO1]